MNLSKKRANAFMGWCAFKGTDNIGAFAGKGVASHSKEFLQSDDKILEAFRIFGLTPKVPELIFRQMERYVCLLSALHNVKSDSVKELRWLLFAQNGKEGRQLPPTLGIVKPYIEISYFMSLYRSHHVHRALLYHQQQTSHGSLKMDT